MSGWHIVVVFLALAGLPATLYGLHRLCLWLEARGWLYYKHKKPDSSPASCFVALQNVLEPPARHALHVKDEKRHHAEDEGPGQDHPTTGPDRQG